MIHYSRAIQIAAILVLMPCAACKRSESTGLTKLLLLTTSASDKPQAASGPVAQTIHFNGSPPSLAQGDSATVSATASSGLAVSYATTTPAVCSVVSGTGFVSTSITGLTVQDCIITANQAGDARYLPADQETLTISVAVPSGITAPGAPTGVTATLGNSADQVIVTVGTTSSGGSPITGYTVTSSPSGITSSTADSPITVTCPGTCAGRSFTVTATNAFGTGPASASADIVTTLKVVETFFEPDCQPNDSIFVGTFTLNSTTKTVSNLQGILSESMTGSGVGYPNDTMTWLTLGHQLASEEDSVLGGRLVTTFKNNNTHTFWTGLGGDGWHPLDGIDVGGVYYGFPTAGSNPGNAYAMIFVNTTDPFASITAAQLHKLAYADCAPGGMMGAVCMTGTSDAADGYGTIGTMSGYPVSQVITKP